MTLPAPSFQEGVSASNKPSCDDLGEQAQLKLLEMAAIWLGGQLCATSSIQVMASSSAVCLCGLGYFGTVTFFGSCPFMPGLFHLALCPWSSSTWWLVSQWSSCL